MRRLDEALSGLEIVIGSNPKLFPKAPGTRLRVASLRLDPGSVVDVYYTWDVEDGCCTLHHIEESR